MIINSLLYVRGSARGGRLGGHYQKCSVALKDVKNMDLAGIAEVLRATTKKVVSFFEGKSAPLQRKSWLAYASALSFFAPPHLPQCKILAMPLLCVKMDSLKQDDKNKF